MNKNKYFSNDLDLDAGKALYRKLVKENHPDLGGNAEVTAEIIRCFDQFCGWKMQGAFNEAGDTKTADFNATVFADILKEVMKMNVTVEIIGFWIYCFDSYEVKDTLKAMGFFFSVKHKAWVYNGGAKLKRRSYLTTDQIRDSWGSQVLKNKEENLRIAG